MEKIRNRTRLSTEAWAAIGAVAAALITGIVTLVIHLIPSADNPSTPGPAANPPATSGAGDTTLSATGAMSTIESMAGNWKGTARTGDGGEFQITLEIRKDCAPDRLCGSIGVSHVPCYGQIFLANVDGDDIEFRVENFDERSNRTVCQPGAGEHFRRQPDGRLAYRTSYEPVAQGILDRA